MALKQTKKRWKQFPKLFISILLLYFVFTKIDLKQIISIYKVSDNTFVVLAVVLLLISQIISSYRLLFVFKEFQFMFDKISNVKLYFIGMFYNFLIPGGIGGDAYKVYILNKTFGWKVKILTKCIISDRLVGLIAIFFILTILGSWLFFKTAWFILLGVILAGIIFLVGRLTLNWFLKGFNPIYSKTFVNSLLVQVFQVLCLCAIIAALSSDETNYLSYIFVFLISSVLSVVSFSGFGVREFVFLQASQYLLIDESFATGIGLLFNLITALISLLGAVYVISKPTLKTAI